MSQYYGRSVWNCSNLTWFADPPAAAICHPVYPSYGAVSTVPVESSLFSCPVPTCGIRPALLSCYCKLTFWLSPSSLFGSCQLITDQSSYGSSYRHYSRCILHVWTGKVGRKSSCDFLSARHVSERLHKTVRQCSGGVGELTWIYQWPEKNEIPQLMYLFIFAYVELHWVQLYWTWLTLLT